MRSPYVEGRVSLRGGFGFPTWSERCRGGWVLWLVMGRRAATGDVAGRDTLSVARERDPPVAARAGRVPYRNGQDARCPSEPPRWRLSIRV